MTQLEVIKQLLEQGKEISQLEATEKYGILRLGAIIHKLRKQGFEISTKIHHKKNRYKGVSHYAVYKMIKE